MQSAVSRATGFRFARFIVVGGTAYGVQWLTMTTGDPLSICYYVIFGSAVALLTIVPLRDRYSEALR